MSENSTPGPSHIYSLNLGGHVSCKSVKLLEDGLEEDDIRDNWWTEIRREVRFQCPLALFFTPIRFKIMMCNCVCPAQIRSHAKALGCNLIVGYTEDTVIS